MRIWILILVAFPVLFAGCSGDDNNNPIVPDLSPTITSINPSTFSRGANNVTMTISGTNFNGATGVSCGNGIGVLEVTVTNQTTITVRMNVQRQSIPGKRDVTVTTPKGTGRATAILTIEGEAPVANFSQTPSNDINEQTVVEFDGSASTDADGTVKSFDWNFGDGKKGSGKIITHKFAKGSYDVALTVTDNDNQKNTRTKQIEVSDRTEIKCTTPATNHGFLGGHIIGVEGKYAIIQLGKDRTCANSFYNCGDMRLDEPEIFRGIIKEMYFLGDGKFKVLNDCPYRWPPQIGEYDVLIYKKCVDNFCP